MSTVILSPIILWWISKRLPSESVVYDWADLFYTLLPFCLIWAFFLTYFNKPYLVNVITSVQLLLSTSTHSAHALIAVNPEIFKYLAITTLYILFFFQLPKLPNSLLLLLSLLLSFLLFFIISTSLWGRIQPFHNGWFDRPFWFSSLLISSMIVFSISFSRKLLLRIQCSRLDIMAGILMVPSAILTVTGSVLSTLGGLVSLFTAIPLVTATSMFLSGGKTIRQKPLALQAAFLFCFFWPYYLTTAISDWEFTFFDVVPEQTVVRLESGFGEGILTNPYYQKLYGWIQRTSEQYSSENDYVLSYVLSPMVHMIAKRKPSLEDTFISFGEVPASYFESAVGKMVADNRRPKIAYVFESYPAIMPISLKEQKYAWFGKQFSFPAHEPISEYIVQHMTFLEEFVIAQGHIVKCYGDKGAYLSTSR
ncbi:MAG: hypothetical protein ACOZF0_05695 [Thermodesulfobacteriota bacterium]